MIANCEEWDVVVRADVYILGINAGRLRILCAGRSQQMVVHCGAQKLLIVIKNTARPEHEKEAILLVEGYPTGTERDAPLVRNNEPVNLEMLVVGELRVLAGMSRRANS